MSVVGGNNRYPSLQSIADLFRSSINDDFSGATDTPGEGLIATNTAPFMLTFMNSAIRDVYSDLRNVGDPALILDNYILLGIPPLSAPDPTVQVSLGYAGYFNGFTWSPAWTLPVGMQRLEKMWERWNGSGGDFAPMIACPNGLPGCQQLDRMGYYELRQNAIWMPGALVSVDLRIRCRITFPDYLNPATINFSTAYVPILDCQNAIVAKMLVLYARRFAPDQYPIATQEDTKFMGKLQLEVVRQMQTAENMRAEFGSEATTDFASTFQL